MQGTPGLGPNRFVFLLGAQRCGPTYIWFALNIRGNDEFHLRFFFRLAEPFNRGCTLAAIVPPAVAFWKILVRIVPVQAYQNSASIKAERLEASCLMIQPLPESKDY